MMTAPWVTAMLVAGGLSLATPCAAQDYPVRPVRLVVPFAAGGPTDVSARIVAQMMSDLWGRSWVVDNRAGAGGLIGAEIAIKANPDGYTLIMGSNSTFAVNPAVYRKLPYDPQRDLSIIGVAANAPHVLTIRAGLANDLKELLAAARKQPGKLTFASSGLGTIIHMGGEQFKLHAGIDITHVPFKGGGPAGVAMAAGEVDMMVNDLSPVLTHIRAGRLRPIAVADTRRAPLAPEVPTFPELGLPQVISASWFAVAAPVQTPRAIVDRINAGLAKVLSTNEYRERLLALGLEPMILTPQQAADRVRNEIVRWRKLAEAANVRLD